MRYRLIIKPEAEIDILESAKWYEERRSKLGHRFLESVDNKLSLLEKNPLHYQERYKNIRFALIERFPYAIHFTVEKHLVYVHAVLSTHRNPQAWKEDN